MVEALNVAAGRLENGMRELTDDEIGLVSGGGQCKIEHKDGETPAQGLWAEAKYWWCVFTS